MDRLIADILDALRETESLDAAALDRIVRSHSARAHDGRRIFAKKRILPYYLDAKSRGGEPWDSWNIDAELDARFVRTVQMKPRRSASGVATITVITKPWPCPGTCIFCPNDVRMPKSYLHDEPACQRAERCFFDPYLQVAARLHTLAQMGHAVDKIELIVLGGTWTAYPAEYRTWFTRELFRALNDDDASRTAECAERRALYRKWGMSEDAKELEHAARAFQDQVERETLTYNEAFEQLYGSSSPWGDAGEFQRACSEELEFEHTRNEGARHRVVGLVMETRPDTITPEALLELRGMGCTKIQMGIQSLDSSILAKNGRGMRDTDTIRSAFELCRLFGFKIHAHFMVNLLGATPASDIRDYETFVTDPAYQPDEVKLYPCALVAGTGLMSRYDEGSWRPYTEQELLDVLCADVLATPAFTRISRMIRDISAGDIVVGNKKTNLRQLVDARLDTTGGMVREIRHREIGTTDAPLGELVLDEIRYRTTATNEVFLQWAAPDGRIAGFLRLSLPLADTLARYDDSLPVAAGEAMIREVHVYGFATRIDTAGASAQHHGLGRALVERACAIARAEGYRAVNVISAIGTRAYYRKLGFADNGLYQTRTL